MNAQQGCLVSGEVKTERQNKKCKNTESQYESLQVKGIKAIKQAKSQRRKREKNIF